MSSTSFFTKTLGQTLADATNICQVTATGATGNVGLALSVVQAGGVNRLYKVDIPNGATGEGVWKRLASYDKTEKFPNANHWAVDMMAFNKVITLRLVRSKAGSPASTTLLNCKVIAYASVGESVAIADDATTASGVSNAGVYDGAIVTKMDGKLAINSDSPEHTLDVAGNVNASVYKIGGTDVLTATAIGSGITQSALTSVGTLSELRVGSANVFLQAVQSAATGNVLHVDPATGKITYSALTTESIASGGNLSVQNVDASGNATVGNLTANTISASSITLDGNTLTSLLNAKANAADVYTRTQLDAGQLDSRYYTETETNTLLAAKADSANVYTKTQLDAGQLDNRYYTETEINTQMAAKENVITASTTDTYYRGDKTFVALNTAAVAESASNLYFTNARAQTAVVSQTITDGVTTTAPSENAVFDALALKSNAADVYTKTQLDAGQLDNRYYTETETNTLLAAKADSANVYTKTQLDAGQLDNRYYTETEINTQMAAKENVITASTTDTYYRGDKTFVALNTAAVAESAGNLYFTNARAQTAVVSQTITDGVTTTAPSENAVFDALALKSNAADVYTKTQLDAGQLDNRYYTETETNTLMAAKADSANVYTKTQLDAGQLDNRYYTETEIDTQMTTKANVANPSFTGTLSVSGNATIGNVATNVITATAISASSLSTSGNVSAGNLAVTGKLTVNGAEWASSVTYGTTTPFTYYGPGTAYANGVSFYAQTASNGTSFVTPGGIDNSVFTFATAGTYMLQSELETSYPWFPEGEITSFYIKNADSSTRFGAESHSSQNFSCTRGYLMTVAAGDNVRFVVDSSSGNDYEAGIGSCRLTMLKIA